jgi:hypothetical protein
MLGLVLVFGIIAANLLALLATGAWGVHAGRYGSLVEWWQS